MTGTCGGIDLGWFSAVRPQLEGAPCEAALSWDLIPAFRLLHHPRNRKIKHGRGFVLHHEGRDIRLDGLTSQLREVFHPMPMAVSTGGAATGGSARGMEVDKEIEALVNHGKLPTSDTLLDYTVKTLQHLHKNGLQPFACQFLVYDGALGIATPLDILCINRRLTRADCVEGSNVVIVELKTGFENNNYHKSQGYMVSPAVPNSRLRELPDSQYMRHQLQLFVQFLITKYRYNRLVREARLVVISADRHSSYPLARDTMDLFADINNNLIKRKELMPVDTLEEACDGQDRLKAGKAAAPTPAPAPVPTPAPSRKRSVSATARRDAAEAQRLHKKAKQMFSG